MKEKTKIRIEIELWSVLMFILMWPLPTFIMLVVALISSNGDMEFSKTLIMFSSLCALPFVLIMTCIIGWFSYRNRDLEDLRIIRNGMKSVCSIISFGFIKDPTDTPEK